MASGPTILILDPDADGRALAAVLVRRELPQATVTTPSDALAVADALASSPHLAVVSGQSEWPAPLDVMQMLTQRSPGTAIVLFACDAELTGSTLVSGLLCDGVLRKSIAGYLALGPFVRDVLARHAAAAAQEVAVTPPAAAPDQPAAALQPAAVSAPQGAAAEGTGAELRDVALVVSHDACEPLQQIVRLVRRAEHTDRESRTLQQVLECAERASGMLERLVEYLTVGALDRAHGPVDLNACLNQALDNLRNTIDDAGAEIRAAFLPMAMGDEDQIVHLFQNLLSNAINYHGHERPLITISIERRGAQWLLAFCDNGIGIPPGATERIFELGKRLHTRDERRGHGVGLALCRRIVERHGGRIWSESREGGGSIFYLLLPRVPAEVARTA